ncbi:MAG TPA: HEAT repeat domain-containing protein [Polyangiaceae bacterium]|nr:HEAT repeat domain-containing protein [Polyangiaceae bacterium]
MDLWSPLPRSLAATHRDATHAKSRVRLSAVADLARWAQTDERASCISRLCALLDADPDVEVRAAAALGLADAGLREGLPALLRVAASGPPRVAQMALIAIGELANAEDAEALDAVRAALASDAPALRFQALVAAGRVLPPDELERCVDEALADGDARLRYIACRIVEERFFSEPETGSPSVDPSQQVRLGEKLEPLLGDSDADVAIAVAVLLAPRGSTAARALLVKALNGRRHFTQLDDERAAIELCADLGLDAARPGLHARAFGGALLSSSPLAFQARVALARLGDERAKHHILRGLSSWSRSVRAQCVAAAGLARLEAARPRLLEMRRDERTVDPRSVTEALLALDR